MNWAAARQKDVCPAKTQIRLGVCLVWSESSLSAWRNLGSLAIHEANGEDSRSDWADDQADLSLRWAHSPYCLFCHAAAQFVLWKYNRTLSSHDVHVGRVKWFWYLSPMRAAKVQASLRIRAVSPEPSLLAHRSSESRGTFRQKARSLVPLND